MLTFTHPYFINVSAAELEKKKNQPTSCHILRNKTFSCQMKDMEKSRKTYNYSFTMYKSEDSGLKSSKKMLV